ESGREGWREYGRITESLASGSCAHRLQARLGGPIAAAQDGIRADSRTGVLMVDRIPIAPRRLLRGFRRLSGPTPLEALTPPVFVTAPSAIPLGPVPRPVPTPSGGTVRVRLLDRVRQTIRTLHYSPRTEEAYVYWIRRFIFHHGVRHPD